MNQVWQKTCPYGKRQTSAKRYFLLILIHLRNPYAFLRVYLPVRKFASRACLLLIAIMSPGIVYAAGLGRLTVNSALGQPLSAEIDLVAVKKEEKSSLTARLASENTFRQANVDYSLLLSTFKTSIETHPDGRPYVRIISPD